jgi:hypothetical protein
MMPRVDAPLTKASIYVYYGDHAPPHFHVVGPDTDVLIEDSAGHEGKIP